MRPTRSPIAEFFAREGAKLAAFVRHRLDDAVEVEAEDLVQDVFASLIEKADPLSEIGNLSGYVYRSLRNRIIDRLRARRPTTSLEKPVMDGLTLSEILPHPDGNPSDLLIEAQRERAFAEAFESLPEFDRDLIEANEFEGLTFEEISKAWRIPVGTLLSRKSRAIKRLSSALSEHAPSH
ncbi:MAG: sigma-70 family RNA polymerase sigma factor [Fibrobacteria bacterium]|nr:sigma-70 family RNA polymerase sigma factor [Fibrobacteria bacterium]